MMMVSNDRYAHRTAIIRLARCLWLLMCVCMVVTACSRSDDAQQIRAHIARAAELAEAHNVGAILDLATADVRALPMDLDRRGIRAVLWRTFNIYGPLTVLYPRPPVEIHTAAGQASTEFPLLMVRKEVDIPGLEDLRNDPSAWMEAVSDHADLYRLRLQWINDDGTWRVDLAVVERFDGIGFNQ
jgi:hypothetical protein